MARSTGFGFVALGDIHGDWAAAASAIADAGDVLGERPRLAICVGDAEANRNQTDADGICGPAKYRWLGTFPEVCDGTITLDTDLVAFIGGNHEPWPALDDHDLRGEWAPGVRWLGRYGIETIDGLNIAWLSGIHSPRHFDAEVRYRDTPRARTYYSRNEIETLATKLRKQRRCDLLVIHDWPSGIGVGRRGGDAGRPELRGLVESSRARLVLCGHHHHRLSATIGDTRIEALGHIRSGADGWAAFRYDPASRQITAVEDRNDG